jgi:hypothetical protein
MRKATAGKRGGGQTGYEGGAREGPRAPAAADPPLIQRWGGQRGRQRRVSKGTARRVMKGEPRRPTPAPAAGDAPRVQRPGGVVSKKTAAGKQGQGGRPNKG